jgi:hypothetical protein
VVVIGFCNGTSGGKLVVGGDVVFENGSIIPFLLGCLLESLLSFLVNFHLEP